jgi:hypothetical protein
MSRRFMFLEMTKDDEPGTFTEVQGQGFRQNLIRESFDKLFWQVSGFIGERSVVKSQ